MTVERKDPREILQFARKNEVKFVDIRFTDLPGLWHHISFPIRQLSERSFEDGFGIDGSSIRGWAAIHESDMLLIPDPSWYMLDSFTDVPTLVMIGDIIDPITKQHYERDPRYIANKAEAYLRYAGIADAAHFGAEAEFLSLIVFASISARTAASTSLTPKKVAGIPAAKLTTSATARATRRDISRCRPPTTTRTCAARWPSPWRNAVWKWNATTTRWLPEARRRLTRNSIPWSGRLTS